MGADAKAKLTNAQAKEAGAKKAAQIKDAANKAKLMSTVTLKSDEACFVSSGLNAGTKSYKQLEQATLNAKRKAKAEQMKSVDATKAAKKAEAGLKSAEVKSKENDTKAKKNKKASEAVAQAAAVTAQNNAQAKAVAGAVANAQKKTQQQ